MRWSFFLLVIVCWFLFCCFLGFFFWGGGGVWEGRAPVYQYLVSIYIIRYLYCHCSPTEHVKGGNCYCLTALLALLSF